MNSRSLFDEEKWLSARVPRYTSYPTAPHFHAQIDSDTYRKWLGELKATQSLSLYIHIPFCDTLCWFCGCHTQVTNTYKPVTSYLNFLFQEIDYICAALREAPLVRHIHWGGGSPTLLSPDDIVRLSDHIASRFTIAHNAEFAVEVDPRGLTKGVSDALAASGVTRASLGVQDCDETVQRAINRIQPFAVTSAAAQSLRAAGIQQLNLDIMYGLPHQTRDHIRRTLEAALTLTPDRVAVFGYAHVQNFKKHQKLIDESVLPDAAERLRQQQTAHDILTSNGYTAVGMDHFALDTDSLAMAQKSQTLKRNFQGYTTDAADALLGFGASAISSLPQGYVQNLVLVPEYRTKITAGKLPVARGIALTHEDRLRRTIIEHLMCAFKVDLTAISQEFGVSVDHFRSELSALAHMNRQGLVEVSDGVIRLRPGQEAAVRLVCAIFDEFFHFGAGNHAAAV